MGRNQASVCMNRSSSICIPSDCSQTCVSNLLCLKQVIMSENIIAQMAFRHSENLTGN